jgi:hypothetical protein
VSGRGILIVVLVILVGTQIVWFGDFFRRCWKAAAGDPHRTALTWAKARQSSNQLQAGTAQQHHKLLELEHRRVDTMLVVGSIGLAAWSQLFVSSKSPPTSRLSGFTLGLLFAGAFCLLVGPVLWRNEGLHLTLMGRQAFLNVGFGLIALSLVSVVLDLRLPLAWVAAAAVAVLIGLREVAEVATWIRYVHSGLHF